MKKAMVALAVALAGSGAARVAASDSIGFNFARAGTPLSYLGTGAAGRGVPAGDPFSGLYIVAQGHPGSLYLDVERQGTYTNRGLVLTAPYYSQNYPYYGYYWANASVSAPADNTNFFKRCGAGGVGVEEPHSSGAFTLSVSGVPYSRYDLYIAALNAYSGTGSLTVSNAATVVRFRLGAWLPNGTGGWSAPVRITDTGSGGNAAGNWMVVENLSSAALTLRYSTAGGWKGGIGCIQFVNATAGGPLLLLR